VLGAGIGALVAGALIGFFLMAFGSWPILLLGLIGVPIAWAYTAPPLKLAYRGLGEVAVFFAMGPLMVLGAYLVHRAPFEGLPGALAASLPVGCLVAAILHANNVRDLEDDRRVGKRTLATILGPVGARRELDVLLGAAYGLVPLLAFTGLVPWIALVTWFSAPRAWAIRKLAASSFDPQVLRPLVRMTANVHLRFGLLLAAGVATPGLVRAVLGMMLDGVSFGT
jgi:1,4-dihydroxy-2-naphthoate octaprenyltransferase